MGASGLRTFFAISLGMLLLVAVAAAQPVQPSTGDKASKSASELQLEWAKVNIERARLDLEKRKFAEERARRPATWERLLSSPGAGAFVTGLLGIMLFCFFSKPWEGKKLKTELKNQREKLDAEHGNELEKLDVGHANELKKLETEHRAQRERLWDELAIERNTSLLKKRTEVYQGLWSYLAQLPLYPLPLPDEFTYERAKDLQKALRKWYFDGGGMYLTLKRGVLAGSRARYFALQRALVLLSQERVDGTRPMVQADDSLSPDEAKQDECDSETFLQDRQPLPSDDFGRYRKLRALGSLLRTAIIQDLGTRDAPGDQDAGNASQSTPARVVR